MQATTITRSQALKWALIIFTGQAKQIKDFQASPCFGEREIPTGLYLRSKLPACQPCKQILQKKPAKISDFIYIDAYI
jgi:hypothetical protein